MPAPPAARGRTAPPSRAPKPRRVAPRAIDPAAGGGAGDHARRWQLATAAGVRRRRKRQPAVAPRADCVEAADRAAAARQDVAAARSSSNTSSSSARRISDRRGHLSLRARRQPVPDRDGRRGARHRRAAPPRARQGREPRPDHAHGIAAARSSPSSAAAATGAKSRASTGKPAWSRCTRTRPRALEPSVVRSDDGAVASLFHAAGNRAADRQSRHHAARSELHRRARRHRDDRVGARRHRDRALAVDAATTAGPTRISGSRRQMHYVPVKMRVSQHGARHGRGAARRDPGRRADRAQ